MTSLSYKHSRIILAQATLFAPDADISPNRIAKDLPEEWRRTFTGPMTNLGIVDGLPDEVPTLILEDEEGRFRAEVASARLNIFVREPDLNSSLTTAVFSKELKELWTSLRAQPSFRVGRLAAVTHRMLESEDPGRDLAHHFCKENWHSEPFNRPRSFELHAHKQYSMPDDTTVNSWVRCKTATVKAKGEARRAIIIEQDVNTLAERAEDDSYDDDEIKSFYETTSQELEQIIRKYFPHREAG